MMWKISREDLITKGDRKLAGSAVSMRVREKGRCRVGKVGELGQDWR